MAGNACDNLATLMLGGVMSLLTVCSGQLQMVTSEQMMITRLRNSHG
jgi:hypothetical protein